MLAIEANIMSTIRIPRGSVVLVCDGAKALILRN